MLVQQKKVQAADWKIALIHYLIGGFAAPLILGTLSSRIIPSIVGAILTGGMIFLAMSSFSSAQLFLVISSLILGLAIFYIASRMYITATPGQISPIVPPS